MLTAQRHQIIRDALARDGKVVSGDLARRFDLSEDTVRRDLRTLAAEGACRRVYGGAVAPESGPLALRHDRHAGEKAALARAAVGVLERGQSLLIDAGSTNSAIAAALPEGLGLTVLTNAPDIAARLAGRRDLRLVVLGGVLDPDTGACTGPQTLAGLAEVRADWLFLGGCGVSAEAGVTAFDPHEAEVKRAMVAVSDRVLVAATADKLGTAAPFPVLPSELVSVLVTQGPPGPLGRAVRAHRAA